MKHIEIRNNKLCCGCGACALACPKHSITMKEDKEGFLYPIINDKDCIQCSICVKKCPLNNLITVDEDKATDCYAAYSLQETVRLDSSSGGIFSLLAEEILVKDGVVYGTAFDENFNVRHIQVIENENIDCLRKSKYVQSDLSDSYYKIRNELNERNKVFFTGTPCQVAGLYSFLGTRPEGLLTADIVCMGVPSPKIYRQYLSEKEKEYDSKVSKIDFRLKAPSWQGYKISLSFSNGKSYQKNRKEDDYMMAFSNKYILRPSCYDCKFKSLHHISDITLGDFWGIETVCPEMFDDKGTSMVLLHTEKGKEAFQEISSRMKFQKIDLQIVKNCNPHLVKSAELPSERKEFFAYSKKTSLHKAVSKYIRPSIVIRLWNGIRQTIHKIKTIK